MPPTPQAVLPEFFGTDQALRNMAISATGVKLWEPPVGPINIVNTDASPLSTVAFDNVSTVGLPLCDVIIQNVGTNVIYWSVNYAMQDDVDAAGATPTKYHGILGPGVDGAGAQLTFKAFRGIIHVMPAVNVPAAYSILVGRLSI